MAREPSVSLRISSQTLTILFPSPYYSTFSSLQMSYHNKSTDSCIHGRRHRDDHEVWVWSESCDDTSETRPRQVFFSTVPIVIPARDNPQAKRHHGVSTHKTSAPSSVDFLVRFALALSPPPSRASTSKPRKHEIVHNAAISIAEKGVVDHSLLSREDESQIQPWRPVTRRGARAATPRCALLVPIKPGIGDG